ncbi:MAG: type II toxin-antitoxin system mRNA interferase toxin, RelE/StbE family [Candidatus Levybacteria bacterium]|nr:type II toxin-antitoxin system mRNA interferase toxin, RelE/StbE family [Candidatus Levybacteria bacterium]
MRITLHPNFEKSYKARIAKSTKLILQVEERIKRFQKNPTDSVLRNHALKGNKKGVYSFSVTGGIRILYIPVSKDQVILIDIGTHNQVY